MPIDYISTLCPIPQIGNARHGELAALFFSAPFMMTSFKFQSPGDRLPLVLKNHTLIDLCFEKMDLCMVRNDDNESDIVLFLKCYIIKMKYPGFESYPLYSWRWFDFVYMLSEPRYSSGLTENHRNVKLYSSIKSQTKYS